jgi:hypothetical protein
MLLDDRQAFELCRDYVESVHASTSTTDVLNLFDLMSVMHFPISSYKAVDA